jgi:aspartate aminotransferase
MKAMRLSDRLSAILPSATLAVTAKAKALKQQGVDVIGFGAGEPDFDTPEEIKAAAGKALEEGFTKYTPTAGILELREAICGKLKGENGLEYDPSQVLLSCGAKHSLFNLFQALLNPGDEVLIPSPFWVSYPEMVRLAGGRPVFVPTEEKEDFRLRSETLRSLISERTRAMVINSPSNPTGSGLGEEDLASLAKVAEEKDLLIVSDEIYEKLTYDGFRHLSIASLSESAKERTVVVNGFSKSFSMTGWRLGYAAGPKSVIAGMTTVQDHSTSNPTSFAQKGALAALTGPQDEIHSRVAEFSERLKLISSLLRDIPGVSFRLPRGAFYLFPNFSAYLGLSWQGKRIEGSADLAAYLLEEGKVAVIPGAAFGSDAHLRLSFALARDRIREGVGRIAEALSRLD